MFVVLAESCDLYHLSRFCIHQQSVEGLAFRGTALECERSCARSSRLRVQSWPIRAAIGLSEGAVDLREFFAALQPPKICHYLLVFVS